MNNNLSTTSWRPTATWEKLQARAQLLAKIRQFFANRNILEVDTPTLASASVTAPYLHSMTTEFTGETKQTLYLQTSPEYAMKRLLAAGSGPIYQICKSFRDGETGRHHNPEFTMLEWYRPGFNHHQLMDEMDEFLQTILHCQAAQRLTYQEAFLNYLDLDPHTSTAIDLKVAARKVGLTDIDLGTDKDAWLNLLISHKIEPYLGQHNQPTFLYDFPSSQAALARISTSNPLVAERFEVYINGIELANGFHELAETKEQHQRFLFDLQQRQLLGLPAIPIDHYLLTALANGFPDCAGVALGIDRLIMLATHSSSLTEVIAFPIERA